MKKYTKKDFLEYADGFDYTEDAKGGYLSSYKSDEEIKKDMKDNWTLKDFQKFYGFSHYDWESGHEIKVFS